MKLTVDHLVVVQQNIELPDKCPNEACGHEFKDESEIKVWEYQDQQRTAVVEGDSLDWPSLPSCGDSFLYISWQCRLCEHTLAEHNVKYFDMDGGTLPKPPPGILDLLNLHGTQEVQG